MGQAFSFTPAPPSFGEHELRKTFAENIFRRSGCKDLRIKQAFEDVPRHIFAPISVPLDEVYSDSVLPLAKDSTISQPSLVAFMLESLNIKVADKVLEIGTASGYTAALTAYLTRNPANVYSVEYNRDLLARAKENLSAMGLNEINIRQGDGFYGWSPTEDFDVITASVAMPAIGRKLIYQLRDHGRFVVPLDIGGFQLLLRGHKKDGLLEGTFWDAPLFFVTLQGKHHLEQPFNRFSEDLLKERMDEVKIKELHLFSSWQEELGFIVFLALHKKRVCNLHWYNPLYTFDTLYGWVVNESNFYLHNKNKVWLNGSNRFEDEFHDLYKKWKHFGSPVISDYLLKLDLEDEHDYEGWKLWDFQYSVIDKRLKEKVYPLRPANEV